MATHVFMIEDGKLFLSLVGDGDSSDWLAPTGKEVDEVVAADYTTGGGDFSCNVTSGALTPTQSTTSITIPATFCSAEETIPAPGVTAYSLDVTGLQDVDVVNGISMFLFENDTKHAYFMLGLDGDDPPRAIGRVSVAAGAIGGDARSNLVFTVGLPCDTKPQILFGNATLSEAVPALTGP